MDLRLTRTEPVFTVSDVASTMRWYETYLGFEPDPFPPSPPHVFCILRRDDVEIMLQGLDGYRKPDVYRARAGGIWNVYVRTKNVGRLYDELKRHPEVTIQHELHRQPYGQLEFEVRDPNGYILVFAEDVP